MWCIYLVLISEFVNSDDSISETGEEVSFAGVPGEGKASVEDVLGVLGSLVSVGSAVKFGLSLDVSDRDTLGGGEGDDGEVFGFVAEGVEVSIDVEGLLEGVALVLLGGEVPDFDGSVLLSDEEVLSFVIRVHGDDGVVEGIDSSVEGEFAIEDSDLGVPGSDGEEGVLSLSDVSHGGNPSVEVGGDVFIFTLGVPESEGLVHSSGKDHSVILGESNREDVFSVTSEDLSGGHGGKVPKSESFV